VHAKGDLHIDEHHTAEDTMICLGKAFDQALGDRRGIVRTAHSYVPMDETLALVAVDLGGRAYSVFDAEFSTPRVGQLGTDLIFHLFESLAIHARMNLHAKVLYGRNDHHKVEGLFKALARAMDAATQIDPRRQDVPSTKGTLIA
jgi:imidazoleglycerol-phosphate dehydratase